MKETEQRSGLERWIHRGSVIEGGIEQPLVVVTGVEGGRYDN